MTRVYASLPLSGPQARSARDLLRGAEPALAAALEPPVAERSRFFVAQRAAFGFYGFEAMALILDTIGQAGPDRGEVARVARATRERTSVLGPYSIDPEGHITTTAYGRLRVVDRQLAWDSPPSG